jgi:hypothetical protein
MPAMKSFNFARIGILLYYIILYYIILYYIILYYIILYYIILYYISLISTVLRVGLLGSIV